MSVPTQTELHRPLVEIAASKPEQLTYLQLKDEIISRLNLTDEDVQERTSTNASRLMTNMGFALSRLRRAGLLDRPMKGTFFISTEGRKLLRTHSGHFSIRMLDALVEQKETGKAQTPSSITNDAGLDDDPEKKIREGFEAIRQNLFRELLSKLLEMSPDDFEKLTLTLLERLGYGEGRVVGRSGDGGIDVIINQDTLGLEKVYVQAKRWKNNPVGGPEIRNFSGSLQLRGASKGVFVTTSNCTKDARESAKQISQSNQTILLIDGQELASLMFDRDVGVITEQTYAIKKLDENYFTEI